MKTHFLVRLRLLVFMALICLRSPAVIAATHPLEPLSTDELRSAVEVVLSQGKVPTNAFFPIVALREPPKGLLLQWQPGAELAREAFVTAYDLPAHRTYEGIVDLNARRLVSWALVPGAEPLQTTAEFMEGQRLLLTNEDWIAALQRRGITDTATVDSGAIPIGAVPLLERHPDARMLLTTPFLRNARRTTWEPVEGLMAVIDMSQRKVVEIVDRGVYPVSRGVMDFFDPLVRGPQDPALKPLTVSQAEGPNFTVSDHAITWDRWRFRYSVHPREGLILHQIAWEESPGKLRPVLFRASVADLLVPYADTDPLWSWRAYFDEADFGLGHFAQPLRRGFTTAPYATLLNEPLCDGAGGARTAQDIVDIYERDAGILWSHTETDTGTAGPRARELVIGMLSTIGNYDYRFQWSFRQDGSIEFHVYLTGVMQLKGTHSRLCAACAPDAG
ncbi:MAG: hypothetical protein KIT22_16025, partial [Verrucomicrobiae bacterium]|nr:hypothetical protein [Verrucomicrobiae bacterium]